MNNQYVKGTHNLFTAPPELVPAGKVDVSGKGRWRIWEFAGTKIDAPILGNGDLISAFAGPTEYPQFWLSTNDFWQMESNANYEFFHDNDVAKRDPPVGTGSPRPLGRMVFDIPQMKDAKYEVRQTFEDATTRGCFTLPDGKELHIDSWVAATENELFVEFSGDAECDISFEFFFPNELGKGCDIGVDCMGDCDDDEMLAGTFKGLVGGKPVQVRNVKKGLLWGYREFSEKVDVATKLGFAAKFLNEDSTAIHFRPGEKATFVCAVRSWAKTSRPTEYARSRARWIQKTDIDALRALHESWWTNFWNVSGIHVDDEQLMTYYYLSQYMLASVSRDMSYPPNILGICTYDRMAWNGNYKINYNHQSPYLGLLASGHFEQSDPHDTPYLDMLDIGREMCQRLLGHPGAYLPLGLGPIGMVSEPLLLHMKSPSVHGALNMMIRWRLSMDKDYLMRVWPFLHSVAEFWENDLTEVDGVLHTNDSMHERITKNIIEDGEPLDPTNSLGYIRSFFTDMIDASKFVGLDEEKIPVWQSILDRLAPYRVGMISEIEANAKLWNEGNRKVSDLIPKEMQNLPVFFNERKGSLWSMHFPGNIMQIYPAGMIGIDSPKEELEIARNTVSVLSEMEHALVRLREAGEQVRSRGAWNATNLGCLFFPAAVRIGFDPETILFELKDKLTRTGLPNGYIKENPHGIENLSTVPNTLQEMMMLSHQGTIHLFPVWPKQSLKNAGFFGMRAYGGFVVSAEYADGAVRCARIESPKGGTVRVENPWKESGMLINGTLCSDEIAVIETKPGDVLELKAAM